MTAFSAAAGRFDTRSLLRQTFSWMTIGLIFTAIVAWFTSQTDALNQFVVSEPTLALVGMGVWLVLGLGFGFFVRHVPTPVGIVLFFLYCAFTGLSLSWVVVAYTEATIVYALLSTVGLFGITTIFALFTRLDLTRWWVHIIIGILGLVVATALNALIFRSEALDLVLSLVGVAVFSISTAASVQKIVRMEHELEPRFHDRAAIIGAMMLYTNFINLFLRLLQLYARAQQKR